MAYLRQLKLPASELNSTMDQIQQQVPLLDQCATGETIGAILVNVARTASISVSLDAVAAVMGGHTTAQGIEYALKAIS